MGPLIDGRRMSPIMLIGFGLPGLKCFMPGELAEMVKGDRYCVP